MKDGRTQTFPFARKKLLLPVPLSFSRRVDFALAVLSQGLFDRYGEPA